MGRFFVYKKWTFLCIRSTILDLLALSGGFFRTQKTSPGYGLGGSGGLAETTNLPHFFTDYAFWKLILNLFVVLY